MKEKLLASAPVLIAALLNLGLTLILSGLFSGFDRFSLDRMLLPAFIGTTISFLQPSLFFGDATVKSLAGA